MLSGPCFSNGMCVQVRAPLPTVHPSPGTEVYSNVGFYTPEKSTATTFGCMSGGGAALVGFVAMCTGVARRRSNKSRKQSSALHAFSVFGASAPNFDYCLDGKGSIKKQIKVKHAPGDPLSFGAFMSRPLSEFSLIPLPAGVKMKLRAEEVSPFTKKMEVCSDLSIPPIEFPGVFAVHCTIGAYCAKQPNGSVVIEADQLSVKATGADVGDPAARVKFHNRTQVNFVDTANAHEMEIKADITMKWDPPGPLRMVLPEFMFRPVGDVAMKQIMDLVLNAFATAFEREYHRWASDEAYRADCAHRAAALEASLKKR